MSRFEAKLKSIDLIHTIKVGKYLISKIDCALISTNHLNIYMASEQLLFVYTLNPSKALKNVLPPKAFSFY